jgi:murein DD-endopeptidase MepM/ murein hydrolase activator NlpD
MAQFESLFLFQLLQTMRKTIPQSDLFGKGFAHELYASLFDQEVAQQVAQRGGIGLTSLLRRQFGEKTVESSTAERSLRSHLLMRPSEPPAQGPVIKSPPEALAVYRQQMEPSTLPSAPSPLSFAQPVQGRLSSDFGWRIHPITQTERFHHGIDIAAPEGALIQAAAPGQVIFSGEKSGYGNLVIIDHLEGYQTYYGHNAENLVRVGDRVEQGQPIAKVGQTGRATGPHVHFEIRKEGQALDPATLLSAKRAKG